MPEFKEKVRISNVTVKRSTEKALLCVIEGEEVWIPQSQIDDSSEVFEELTDGDLVISLWCAEQNGLA